MACISRSSASLRIIGDDLIPDYISQALGASPTKAQTKGEKLGNVRIAKFGMWRLEAIDCEPEDINGQIRFIFDQLTDDLAVWKYIGSQFKMDLFCGLFMECWNEGIELSPESLLILGSRGIKIDFDVYGPVADEKEATGESGPGE